MSVVLKNACHFADIETTEFMDKDKIQEIELEFYELEYKLGCIVSYDHVNDKQVKKYYTLDQDEFCAELVAGASRRNKKVVYFHNLAFDSKFFIQYLRANFTLVKPIRTSSKLLGIHCYQERTTVKNGKVKKVRDCVLEFRDSLALLITSIKKLGNVVGIEKLDFDFDYSSKESVEQGINYCYNDCIIIYESIKFLIKTVKAVYDIDYTFKNMKITIASLSKDLLRHFYPKVFYKVDMYHEKYLRPYFFGGRTEVFDFNTVKDAVYFDVNSLYPFVLSLYLFANGQSYFIKTDKIDLSNPLNLAYELTIRENQFYPLFPVRLESGKILYRNGVKKVLANRFELQFLTRKGYFKRKEVEILAVHRVLKCNETITFNDFFQGTFFKRMEFKMQDENHPFIYFLKILMNSGYGKFAEKPVKTESLFIRSRADVDISRVKLYDFDGVLMTSREKFQKFMTINLTNGILTTSYARFEMWKMLERCRNLDIKVSYCDTDSILIKRCDMAKLKKYMDEFTLGSWWSEANYDFFQAIDSKEYLTLDHDYERKKMKTPLLVKFKGVKNEYIESVDKLRKFLDDGVNVNLIASIFYCLRRHQPVNSAFIIRKHKRSYFCKRRILDDLSTVPISDEKEMQEIELSNEILLMSHLDASLKIFA